MKIMEILTYLIVFFGVINLTRMAVFMVGSDIYGLIEYCKRRLRKNYTLFLQ